MFRHFLVLLPFAIILELGMLLYGGYLIFRNPDWTSTSPAEHDQPSRCHLLV